MSDDKTKLPKSDKWDIVYRACEIGAAALGGATQMIEFD